MYNDESLNIKVLTNSTIDKGEAQYEKPYVVWEYEAGRIREIERDEERILQIKAVSDYPQADGTLILGIVPNKISSAMEIYIDDVLIPLTVGKEFVSVSIPGEMIEGKTQIAIKLKDEFGTSSDEYTVQINDFGRIF